MHALLSDGLGHQLFEGSDKSFPDAQILSLIICFIGAGSPLL